MVRSKLIPTRRRSRSTAGEPELPPIVSEVETKLSGVLRSRSGGAGSHASGRCQSVPCPKAALRSYSPKNVVYGGATVPLYSYPLTTPSVKRGEKVASGGMAVQ